MDTWIMAKEVREDAKRYLTSGKWYRAREVWGHQEERWFRMFDDIGDSIIVAENNSVFLDGGDWTVHQGDAPPDATDQESD